MSLRKSSLRILRNLFYRRFKKAEERFRKSNRAFLRATVPDSKPIEDAPAITDRRAGNTWKTLQPVWVLSTGRTGTNTLTELLKLSPKIDAYHEPAPELFQFSFDYYSGKMEPPEALQTLAYLRDELVFRSCRDGFVFVETNNRVTYLADLLLELYPGSKFMFIYRNPYDFIRSGMRRKYYSGHMRDYARIKPRPSDAFYESWGSLSDLEKVAWNWQEVNALCLDFMNQLPHSRKLAFSSEEFFNADPDLIRRLFDFAGSSFYHPPASDLQRVMGKKHNAQKKGSFSKPAEWDAGQIEQVDRIVAPVAARLSYELLSAEKPQQESQ